VVRLASNPSTGYSWSVAQNDASLLKPLDDKYVRPDSKQMGAPGNQVFRFKTVGSGGTELILLYQNLSLSGVRAAKKYRVIVTIKDLVKFESGE